MRILPSGDAFARHALRTAFLSEAASASRKPRSTVSPFIAMSKTRPYDPGSQKYISTVHSAPAGAGNSKLRRVRVEGDAPAALPAGSLDVEPRAAAIVGLHERIILSGEEASRPEGVGRDGAGA